MRKKYSYIAIILIVFLFSACQKKEEKFNSTTKTSNSTESTNSIPDEIKSLLALGKYDDTIEINGERDSFSIIKKKQKFLFPKCRILSISYSTFSEDSTFLSLNKKEILKLIDLIEDSPILKNGDSLSNYGVNDNTKEKYAKLCIVYENSHGDLQNVSLNTFKGDILHFYDFNGEDYRIGPNKQLVDFIIKHTGYRVLPATAFDKIEKITVKQLIEFTRISRATFYNYYTNLTEVWQQITNDVLFEMSTLKKEPLVMFSFSDLQLLEQLAQYIKRRQFVIRMLLNKNGDPEFLEKWEQQMKCIILKYLNDKNIYEKKRRDEMSEFLAVATVHKIIKAIFEENSEHILSTLISTKDILSSFSINRMFNHE